MRSIHVRPASACGPQYPPAEAKSSSCRAMGHPLQAPFDAVRQLTQIHDHERANGTRAPPRYSRSAWAIISSTVVRSSLAILASVAQRSCPRRIEVRCPFTTTLRFTRRDNPWPDTETALHPRPQGLSALASMQFATTGRCGMNEPLRASAPLTHVSGRTVPLWAPGTWPYRQ